MCEIVLRKISRRESYGVDHEYRVCRATSTRTKVWVSGDTLTASDLNSEFNNLNNALAIVNADISGGAGIVFSKLDSVTVAGVSATQTLTNKTLTSPIITGPTITGTIGGNPTITKPTVNGLVGAFTTDTDGTTITFDMSASNVHTVTLGGNRTLAVSNTSTGQAFIIRLIQDGTGNRTVTWFSTIKWAGGSVPTLTTTANKIDVLGFITTGSNTYDGFIVGQNI